MGVFLLYFGIACIITPLLWAALLDISRRKRPKLRAGVAEAKLGNEVWRLDYSFSYRHIYRHKGQVLTWRLATDPVEKTSERRLQELKGYITEDWERTDRPDDETTFTASEEAIRQMKEHWNPEWIIVEIHYRNEDKHVPLINWPMALTVLGWALFFVALTLIQLGY